MYTDHRVLCSSLSLSLRSKPEKPKRKPERPPEKKVEKKRGELFQKATQRAIMFVCFYLEGK